MASSKPHAVVELTLARLREFLREPEAVFWVFAFPVLMALALGIAFRQEREQELVVGVVQEAGSPIADALRGARNIRVSELTREEAEAALRGGEVMLVVVPGEPPTYRFDPTRPESRTARLLVDDVLQRARGRTDVWQARDDEVVAPGSRYIDWLIPGLLGMNIMGTGLWSVGFSVVVARTRKLLKRFMATPMPRSLYLLSHLLARLVFLVLEVSALLLFAHFVFGVSSAGSLWLVAGLALLGAFTFAGIGLLIASRAKTIEGVSGLMNLVMLPMWLLSGVFFSSSNFPDVAQPFIRLLPLTALNDALRAVMLEGRGVAAIAPEAGLLGVWAVTSFLAALKLFRWR
ncbi:MAG TPA: ABC transporter permease [Vicinamibacterales bacterium]